MLNNNGPRSSSIIVPSIGDFSGPVHGNQFVFRSLQMFNDRVAPNTFKFFIDDSARIVTDSHKTNPQSSIYFNSFNLLCRNFIPIVI